jgi:hypothetical protein
LSAADYNNDGLTDTFLGGNNGTNLSGAVYRANPSGDFVPVLSPFPTNINSVSGWGDYDNDGRLDLALSSGNISSPRVNLYHNDVMGTNTPPSPPLLKPAVAYQRSVLLSWSDGSDQETAATALTYSLRVGRAPGGVDIYAPNAGVNGARRVADAGNMATHKAIVLTNLSFGTYYWAVQAVDSSFAGSSFSAEQVLYYKVSTVGVSNVTSSTAALIGAFDTNANPSTVYFEWGTTTNYGFQTALQNFSTNNPASSVAAFLNGLLPGTQYHFRCVLTNAAGFYAGGDISFTTVNLPQINAGTPSNISNAGATLNASVNPNRAPTAGYFEYGLSQSYGSATQIMPVGNGSSFLPLTASIFGLIGGQVYHYRIVATNSAGPTYTADLTFMTTPQPEVNTSSATAIAAVSASLVANVRPNTLPTSVYFEYGVGSFTSNTVALNVGAGTNLSTVTIPVTGLTRLVTYQFRAVASNSFAVTYGGTRTFTTINDVIALAPTNITMVSAVLNGLIDPTGLPTTASFEFGTASNLWTIPLTNVLSGTNLVPVSVALTNLTPATSYFTRLVATNSSLVRTSSTVVFQTLAEYSVIDPGLVGSSSGALAWGDYDSDGYVDMLVSDSNSTRIYRNLGNGAFTNVTTTIPGTTGGSVSWGDFNNDGWLDILITGNSTTAMTGVYKNNGNGTFTDVQAGLPGLIRGKGHWADFDNDGRVDILLVGENASNAVAAIWRNTGSNSFVNMQIALPPFLDAASVCADYDNDGRMDLLLMGRTGLQYSNVFSTILHNDGNWSFRQSSIPLAGVRNGFADWGDYDGDGNLDLIIGGAGTSLNDILRLYHNTGDGSFSETALPPYACDAISWGDCNNDGRLDLLMRGQKYYSSIVPPNSYSGVLENNGDGTFTPNLFALPEMWSTCGGWADYDRDGKLDAVISGNSRSGAMLRLYHNNNMISNTPPSVPTDLKTVSSYNSVVLSWNKATDAQASPDSLTYSVRVGTNSGGTTIVSPLSSPAGLRRVVAPGNAGQNRMLQLTNLPPGTYYWSVQSVDTAFAGSPFAPEGTFIVSALPSVITSTVTNISTTASTLEGIVFANGFNTWAFIEWGQTTNLGTVSMGGFLPNPNTNLITVRLDNLLPDTAYFYRVVASNLVATVPGGISSWRTAQLPTLSSANSSLSVEGNTASFRFGGTTASDYGIFISTNLSNWTYVGTATEITSNQFQWTDSQITNTPAKFYRIAAPPTQ